jgi:hypothetical protein
MTDSRDRRSRAVGRLVWRQGDRRRHRRERARTPVRLRLTGVTDLVIEQVASYGMPVGAEVFETVFWSGRFAEASVPRRVHRITRKAIVTHLCGSARAKDSNVRQALIDRFGGTDAIGRKATPGPLYGVTRDVWAALAVAICYVEAPPKETP